MRGREEKLTGGPCFLVLKPFQINSPKEGMAEPSAICLLPLAKPHLEKVLSHNGRKELSVQEHQPVGDPMPLCGEENPLIRSSPGEDKDCCNSRTTYSLGANQCFHCLITFPDEKFKERHMKREHPEDFVRAYLRDSLFVCFNCSKAFESSWALISHQRGHAPASPSDCLDCGHHIGRLANCQSHHLDPSLPHQGPYCGKSFRQLSYLHHQTFHQQTQALVPGQSYSCTECGEKFTQEADLHEHYIRHARGKLWQWP